MGGRGLYIRYSFSWSFLQLERPKICLCLPQTKLGPTDNTLCWSEQSQQEQIHKGAMPLMLLVAPRARGLASSIGTCKLQSVLFGSGVLRDSALLCVWDSLHGCGTSESCSPAWLQLWELLSVLLQIPFLLQSAQVGF